MFCIKCGKQISDDSKFCSFCGASVEKSEDMQNRVDKPAIEKKNAISAASEEQHSISAKTMIAVSFVFFFAIALGVLVLSSGPKLATSKPATPSTTMPAKQEVEVQKIPAPISIERFEVDINVIGEPIARIQIKNESDKTIDGYKVLVSVKDNFGKDVREFGSGEPIAHLINQREIAPGDLSNYQYYWTLHGYETGTKFHAKLYEIHYTDGSSWKATQSDPVEADAVKTNNVID